MVGSCEQYTFVYIVWIEYLNSGSKNDSLRVHVTTPNDRNRVPAWRKLSPVDESLQQMVLYVRKETAGHAITLMEVETISARCQADVNEGSPVSCGGWTRKRGEWLRECWVSRNRNAYVGGGDLTGKAQHAEFSCYSLPKNNRLPEKRFHRPPYQETKVGLIRTNTH